MSGPSFFGRFWGSRFFGRPYWGPGDTEADSSTAASGALAEDEEDILLLSAVVSVTDQLHDSLTSATE